MFPDPANATTDFEHDIGRMNADVAKQKLTRAGATLLDNGFILGAANVHLRTRKRFRERRPNALVVRTHH